MSSLPTDPTAQGHDMRPGEVLNRGNSIWSPNGEYKFVFQAECNLVLRRRFDGQVLWASGTQTDPEAVCIMQEDGNLVIYTPGPLPKWESHTEQYAYSHLAVQDDGNVLIYSADGVPVWSTQTGQPPAVVDATSYIDKVPAGYQGWFRTDGDGAALGWVHWAAGERPRRGNVTFELYPDVSDYADMDLYHTGLGNLGSGEPARLFSSHSRGVIDTHFGWMREYGLDGVGLQRFVVNLYKNDQLRSVNQVASLVRSAAEEFGRVFHIQYDLTNAGVESWVEDVKRDWHEVIVGQLHATSSQRYVRQDGKPVVILWGLGFPDRPYKAPDAVKLVGWLKEQDCFVGAGVPYHWRERSATGYVNSVYPMLDLIQPWAVGEIKNIQDVQSDFDGIVKNDLDWTAPRRIHYQRVVFPGFAWSNWKSGSPQDEISRLAGDFFWSQAKEAAKRHMSVFIAMFDEYDEATAIAKAAEDKHMIPNDQYFLTLEADGKHVSSDFYLRLAGVATRMIKWQDPVWNTVPIPFEPA